jgi:hypothetical protein
MVFEQELKTIAPIRTSPAYLIFFILIFFMN